MNCHGTSLSPTELVNKLNDGGWIVSGGHQVRELGFSPKLPVVRASLLGETLKIETGDRNFEVPSDNIVLINPWTAEINHTFMRRQQRKKIEGGGWHEVPAVRVVLRVTNPEIEKSWREAQEAEAKCAREKRQEANRQRRTTEMKQFLASIKRFVGEKITDFQLLDWDEGGPALIVKFESGNTMRFEFDMNDCEGGYCCATAKVNGTSLRFEPESVN